MNIKPEHKLLKNVSSCNGYTLTELLIYMLVASIVIVLALSLMRTTFKNYTLNTKKTELQEIGRDAIVAMTREIANTGLKYYIDKSGAPNVLRFINGSYVSYPDSTSGSKDLSSFNFWPNIISGNPGPSDSLEIIKALLDDNGQSTGVVKIRYSRNSNNELIRKLWTYGGGWPANPSSTMVLATNVEVLQFQFATVAATTWQNTLTVNDKKNVKVIRVLLLMKIDSGTAIKSQTSYTVADYVAPPASDGYIRRLYQEEMEVENNGLF